MKKIPYVFEKPHKLSAKTNTSTEKRAESREEGKKTIVERKEIHIETSIDRKR